MLNDASVFTKVIIAVGYTDLRRGIEGLATTIKSSPLILSERDPQKRKRTFFS